MPDHKKKKRTLKRVLKWLLTLVILGVVALIGWIYLVPMITADAVTVYQSYTAETGDINTTKSFSATLSVKKSETFSSGEECTVRDIYVQSGDEVKKGDQLILLSTGELFTASFDGVVNEIRVKEGDWLWPNFQVVQICDLQHLEVSMDVDEYDVEELSVGQTCTVSVISLGINFDTVIAHINRVSQSSGTVAFYSVTCDLTVPENVLPGMQATVTLPSDSVTGVTVLDMAALAYDDNKTPYVLEKQSDGTYKQVSVETGLSDGMKVEIKSGLSAGDTVYAVTGTESVKAAVSLEDIYKAIVGQTTVINDKSSDRSGRGTFSGGAPSGEMPQWGTSQTATEGTQMTGTQTSGDQTAAQSTATTNAAVTATVTEGTGTTTSTNTSGTRPQRPEGTPPAQMGSATGAITPTATPAATATTSQEGGSTNAN